MLQTLLVAVLVLGATWGLLVVAAKRLPPGILKDLAGFLPACLTTVHRLRNNPQVPARAKLAVLVAGLWLLSPIDLLPEFLPVIGPLDDVLVVAWPCAMPPAACPARSCWTPGRPTPGCWSASSGPPPGQPAASPGYRGPGTSMLLNQKAWFVARPGSRGQRGAAQQLPTIHRLNAQAMYEAAEQGAL